MNRVLLHRDNLDYLSIISYSSVIYDYVDSPLWHCIEVDDESLCILKLTYDVHQWNKLCYSDMPTYVIYLF